MQKSPIKKTIFCKKTYIYKGPIRDSTHTRATPTHMRHALSLSDTIASGCLCGCAITHTLSYTCDTHTHMRHIGTNADPSRSLCGCAITHTPTHVTHSHAHVTLLHKRRSFWLFARLRYQPTATCVALFKRKIETGTLVYSDDAYVSKAHYTVRLFEGERERE